MLKAGLDAGFLLSEVVYAACCTRTVSHVSIASFRRHSRRQT